MPNPTTYFSFLFSDICLYDGVLSQQYDWKSVDVHGSFWNHVKWWVTWTSFVTQKYSEQIFEEVLLFDRCAGVVQAGVGSPAIHAAARANSGQWNEDERSHEYKTAPLLTPHFCFWLESKAPPCKHSMTIRTHLLLFFMTKNTTCIST